MFLSRGDRDLGVAFQTHPGRQAFISSGSKEARSALEMNAVSELKTNKMLPRYIDFIFNKYRVRVRGVALGMYDTLEEAIKVKEDYLKKGE